MLPMDFGNLGGERQRLARARELLVRVDMALTTSTVWLTVDDDEPYRDGCTNSERAEAWVRDGHSFANGPCMISDPDIESVLMLNYTDIVNFSEMIGYDTPVLDGVIALMRAWYERPDIIDVWLLAW